jgi:hypothetical protein
MDRPANASERRANASERTKTLPNASERKRKRSAVSSGRTLFVDGDPSSPWARRFADVVAAHASDLGGRDALSEGEWSLIRRVATIECELEQMEAALSRGEPADLDLFARVSGNLRRLLETLHASALQRRPKDSRAAFDAFVAALPASAKPQPRPPVSPDVPATSPEPRKESE